MSRRREVLLGAGWATALSGIGLGSLLGGAGAAAAAPADATAPKPVATTGGKGGPQPWLKRAFQLYNGPDGQSAIRQVDLPGPQELDSQWLLRRPAERVTMGMMGADFMMDFHVANQPNILIPLFGTLVVKLKDGSVHSFVHGDILFAEDCNGIGHMSGAGPEGCFSVSVQLPKTEHCLDPKLGPTEILAGRGKPKY